MLGNRRPSGWGPTELGGETTSGFRSETGRGNAGAEARTIWPDRDSRRQWRVLGNRRGQGISLEAVAESGISLWGSVTKAGSAWIVRQRNGSRDVTIADSGISLDLDSEPVPRPRLKFPRWTTMERQAPTPACCCLTMKTTPTTIRPPWARSPTTMTSSTSSETSVTMRPREVDDDIFGDDDELGDLESSSP
ncbi:MAG: hypothetical protein Ct9H300mP1_19390 [Planctomycetaceae bacterium]|nr:MAG: hypothetical protein Ct9H300mP1_19390 [Planctomycetaceae bacterium]